MTAELVPAEVLAYHGLKRDDRMAGLMVLLGTRYGLDPLAGHLEVIKTRNGPKLYIARDGYLVFAHRSGQLDGIVVEDLHHGETGWSATVSVWRKDMRYPFRYSAGCGDQEPQALQGDGDSMALARAERRALKRAFPVIAAIENEHGLGGADEPSQGFDVGTVSAATAVPASDRPPPPRPNHPRPIGRPEQPSGGPVLGDWTPTDDDQGEARRVVVNWPVKDRIRFLGKHRIDHFNEPWPPEAVAEVLAGPVGVTSAAGDTTTGPASVDEP